MDEDDKDFICALGEFCSVCGERPPLYTESESLADGWDEKCGAQACSKCCAVVCTEPCFELVFFANGGTCPVCAGHDSLVRMVTYREMRIREHLTTSRRMHVDDGPAFAALSQMDDAELGIVDFEGCIISRRDQFPWFSCETE